MRNIARRLQLHFNGKCEFLVQNKLGAGVTVTLVIPAEDRENEETGKTERTENTQRTGGRAPQSKGFV